MKASITYDSEGCYVHVLDEGELVLVAYEFVKNHGSWKATRAATLAAARSKIAASQWFGERPESETVAL